MSEARQGRPDSSLAEPCPIFLASPGSILAARYHLLSKLGQGGMGTVWRAEDRALCIEVAVKLIDPTLVDSPVALARFQQEAHAAAKLRSTHIVHINDYGIDEATGQPFIAMDLLEGESLQQRLEREGALPIAEAHRILAQVARALELAHSKGIAHRDLKPDNVFIAREGNAEVVKVLDFGIAKRLDVVPNSCGVNTREGQMLGTPNYMSPEQARARADVDHRADIWSFGVIAFECVTGSRPFESDNLASLVLAICNEPLPNPEQHAAVPAGFSAWFARAAARDVHARFPTIVAASDELARLIDMPLRPQLCVHNGVETLSAATIGPATVQAATGAASDSISTMTLRSPTFKWMYVTVALVIGTAAAMWWTLRGPSATDPRATSIAVPPRATEVNPAPAPSRPKQTVAASAPVALSDSVTTNSSAVVDQGLSAHHVTQTERAADTNAKRVADPAPNKPAAVRPVKPRSKAAAKKAEELDPGI